MVNYSCPAVYYSPELIHLIIRCLYLWPPSLISPAAQPQPLATTNLYILFFQTNSSKFSGYFTSQFRLTTPSGLCSPLQPVATSLHGGAVELQRPLWRVWLLPWKRREPREVSEQGSDMLWHILKDCTGCCVDTVYGGVGGEAGRPDGRLWW